MVSILNILFLPKLYTVLCEIVKSQRFAYDKKRRQKQRHFFKSIIVQTSRIHNLHCKKELAVFPSPAGMSLTKLSLGGKNFAQGEFSQ
jgi:hypothetical protein